MRILLVSPNRKREPGHPADTRRVKATFPPLSLLQVAALTPPGYEVAMQDEAVRDLDLTEPCDLVGMTAFTSSAPGAYDVADTFRARGIPVVIGGMHASACPEEALEHCDSVVVGEAEGKWPRLLADAEQGKLQPVYRSYDFPDMATAPAPRRDLLNRDDYIAPDTVQATRGCGHACSFCSATAFFGMRVRARPPEVVAAEVSALPGRVVAFVDDNIMALPRHAARLFEPLVDAGKKWLGQASTAVLQNVELLRLAARSGCQALFVGMESLSAAALDQANKRSNLATRFDDLVKRLHGLGIGFIGAFIFGFDGDDESVFARTADSADRVHLDMPQYSILTPLPGTPLYSQMESGNRIIDRDRTHYDGGHVVSQPRGTTPERLEEGLKEALKHSYSRLGILRRLFGWSARTPLMLPLNVAFRRRAIPFAKGST